MHEMNSLTSSKMKFAIYRATSKTLNMYASTSFYLKYTQNMISHFSLFRTPDGERKSIANDQTIKNP